MPWARRLALSLLILCASLPCLGGSDPLLRLRISLSPMMSSLPIALAHAWGLFEEHGLAVELVGLSDNEERSAALITGDLDGMVSDVTAAILLSSAGSDIVITSADYGGDQTGSLAILSPRSFQIESLQAMYEPRKRGLQVATLYRSDLEYQTDQLFESLGHDTDRPDLYAEWTDLLQLAVWFGGQMVPAAVLPEPYITYISHYPLVDGAPLNLVHLSDFEGIPPLPGVVLFRRSVVDAQPDAVARFYDAYREAIDLINTTSREELIEKGIQAAISLFFPGVTTSSVPTGILDSFVIPHFSLPQELDRNQFASVVDWVNRKGYAFSRPSYDAIATRQFLP